jgi:hypothetical protein
MLFCNYVSDSITLFGSLMIANHTIRLIRLSSMRVSQMLCNNRFQEAAVTQHNDICVCVSHKTSTRYISDNKHPSRYHCPDVPTEDLIIGRCRKLCRNAEKCYQLAGHFAGCIAKSPSVLLGDCQVAGSTTWCPHCQVAGNTT